MTEHHHHHHCRRRYCSINDDHSVRVMNSVVLLTSYPTLGDFL